jgi:hypothetical protein
VGIGGEGKKKKKKEKSHTASEVKDGIVTSNFFSSS